MKPWISDSAEFLKRGDQLDLKKGDLITTTEIERFLDNNHIHLIIAPKGFGKTILLIYKKLLYDKLNKITGKKIIPSDALVDNPPTGTAQFNCNKSMIEFYKDSRNWEGLWRICISLSIIKTIKKSSIEAGYKEKEEIEILESIRRDKNGSRYPLLKELIYRCSCDTPHKCMNHILTDFPLKDVKDLIKEMSFLEQIVSQIVIPIAIFIDNVDEYLSEHAEKSKKQYNPSVRGIFDIDLWYASQQGLMFAIKDMCRSYHHLDIFASIRKEAYEKMDNEKKDNLYGQFIEVKYSYEDLKNIFTKNISWMDRKLLVAPNEIHRKPIMSFIGFDKIHNKYTDEDEDIFDYIYRHTLKRPRDIAIIGEKLQDLPIKERTPENVRTAVNEAAARIVSTYIDICLPHTCFSNKSEILHFLKQIPYNILRLENLQYICSNFNGECNHNKPDCKNCSRKHVFCDLYKIGLLGTVEYDTTDNKYKQTFSSLGGQTSGSNLLPTDKSKEDDYFLIHPMLNNLIGGLPKKHISNKITIGDRRDWVMDQTKIELPAFLTKKYKMFLSHSHNDAKFVEQLIDDLQKEKMKFWYAKWDIKVGSSIRREIESAIKDSEYVGIIISKSSLESGWVEKELDMAIWEKLETKNILPILIDDVWNKAPSILTGTKYADFRKNYKNGLDELIDTLKDSLVKT